MRDAYGRNLFGQGCLLARRLVEQGVPFVEVTMGAPFSWDTHDNNFERRWTVSRGSWSEPNRTNGNWCWRSRSLCARREFEVDERMVERA